jgi:hypothetical protein
LIDSAIIRRYEQEGGLADGNLELTAYLAMNKRQALQVGVESTFELNAYLAGRSAPCLIDSSMNK